VALVILGNTWLWASYGIDLSASATNIDKSAQWLLITQTPKNNLNDLANRCPRIDSSTVN